ncbi:MAG: DNA-binding response regulator [Anaerolineaceae bacterium]|nr:MAG: DNA-binding response regulator [Anaerolineaceae bacterium]
MVTAQDRTISILVVEDDHDTAEMMCALLEDAGYYPLAVDNGQTALEHIEEQKPDMVLLDLRLPDVDGLELLKAVRAHSFLPLIVISGMVHDRDRVHALEAGADDFMSKPFSHEELIARVRALIRRVEWTPQPETKVRVRQLELDMPRRHATINGQKLHLTPIEYSILVTLMRQAGNIISHEELLHAVWGDNYKGDFSVLRVNVSRLRQKLEINPRRPAYIVTVPGRGYWMPLNRS